MAVSRYMLSIIPEKGIPVEFVCYVDCTTQTLATTPIAIATGDEGSDEQVWAYLTVPQATRMYDFLGDMLRKLQK